MHSVGENQEPVPLPAGIRDCHRDVITRQPRAVNTFYYSITKDVKPVVLFRKLIQNTPLSLYKSHFIKITDCVANN